MTTKPKVQKYRIRRAPRTTGGASKTVSNAKTPVDTPNTSDQAPQEPQKNAANATPNVMAQGGDDRLFDNAGQDDGFGDAPYPGSAAATHKAKAERPKGGVASTIKAANSAPERKRNKADTTENGEANDETSADGDIPVDEAIDAIRREGLTGRQLRMARRVAAKHGLAPTSDFDAVRLLRNAGIDPFQKSAVLDLVETKDGKGGAGLPPNARNRDCQKPRRNPLFRPRPFLNVSRVKTKSRPYSATLQNAAAANCCCSPRACLFL